MKNNTFSKIVFPFVIVATAPTLLAGTNLPGDHTVVASGAEAGNLEVAGDLSVWGGWIWEPLMSLPLQVPRFRSTIKGSVAGWAF